MTEKIGFLGLGHMGAPMAANLVKAGYEVLAYDPVPAAREQAAKDGATVVATAVEAAEAGVVITMLPNGRLVLDVYAEILPAAKPGTLFIDCSTIDVADAKSAAVLAIGAGHRALDAPVSGGVAGAAAGTLTFMVGGAADDFATALPVLEVMGGKVVHCGGSGVGQAAKICNNMLLGISMIGLSEALVLGEQLGLTHQSFFDVVSTASGQSWALTSYCPVPGPVPTSPANNDYRPGFATALMTKDLGLAANALRENGIEGRLGLLAAEIYERFNQSSGDLDFSAIVTDIRSRSEREGA
ncbi:3-hydroxyisobutyrate dehydrogenase [Nocardia brasiliensis NBRC 14402]|uniref:3-hydroxyisobutyrate dehydrogenase n=1 Tax=Nocardia brasiliensis TaxID=37326 RepID=UPI0002ED1E29|nr:3-hydroxyisobutyrate dehydrogenase [Nocardia brasiliensis]ASF09803.1 3-hydroxyisobutyrate dehydrogenase [Nocardia brasiliensis]GAJ82258.1 3-hydroxyisobutyrate dehydrogenase [Nocardia brasiliensis NBRC 14402]SUB55133.1 2-(hydroxymethyl)glutarate dehydrogenase [Nocardia brasiliensis]